MIAYFSLVVFASALHALGPPVSPSVARLARPGGPLRASLHVELTAGRDSLLRRARPRLARAGEGAPFRPSRPTTPFRPSVWRRHALYTTRSAFPRTELTAGRAPCARAASASGRVGAACGPRRSRRAARLGIGATRRAERGSARPRLHTHE